MDAHRSAGRGFSLLEVIIALSLVALLAAIALPAYQAHVREARRAAALGHLLELHQRQARWRSEHPRYAGLAALGGAPADAHYRYQVHGAGPEGYVLRAVPTTRGGQHLDAEAGVVCAPLELELRGPETLRRPAPCW